MSKLVKQWIGKRAKMRFVLRKKDYHFSCAKAVLDKKRT